ncbi:MAG: hypothetical protein PHQ23_09625 [Candidatus Wallbacteria bacterium]|nr:hypothetical protein [Candidatus Wallbacteria bacterium]
MNKHGLLIFFLLVSALTKISASGSGIVLGTFEVFTGMKVEELSTGLAASGLKTRKSSAAGLLLVTVIDRGGRMIGIVRLDENEQVVSAVRYEGIFTGIDSWRAWERVHSLVSAAVLRFRKEPVLRSKTCCGGKHLLEIDFGTMKIEIKFDEGKNPPNTRRVTVESTI